MEASDKTRQTEDSSTTVDEAAELEDEEDEPQKDVSYAVDFRLIRELIELAQSQGVGKNSTHEEFLDFMEEAEEDILAGCEIDDRPTFLRMMGSLMDPNGGRSFLSMLEDPEALERATQEGEQLLRSMGINPNDPSSFEAGMPSGKELALILVKQVAPIAIAAGATLVTIGFVIGRLTKRR